MISKQKSKYKPKVIGVFEGECADSNITNANGLDITRPVWESVFSSEDYNQAIELGWYIGFLGHPEDPGCMDFEHACIVMTEGHIDENGKVFGKFNLIDTPVGRIVKSFIDAGVTFGISVRGVGDIIDNSVDPDTFIFRGFDLVTFPAFPESIPKFTEIAASTKLEDKLKYDRICAAIRQDVKNITDNRSLKILQSQFASKSEEYKLIDDQLNSKNNVLAQKLDAMTDMYIQANLELHKLALENEKLKIAAVHDASVARRKNDAVKRIVSAQLEDADADIRDMDNELQQIIAANRRLKVENQSLKQEVENLNSANLKYKQKINSSINSTDKYERILADRESELDETVNELEDSRELASNLDDKLKRLYGEIEASKKMCSEFRDAYVKLYSSAVGADAGDLNLTADMSLAAVKGAVNSITRSKHISDIGNIKSFEVTEIEPPTRFNDDDIITM